MINSASTRLLSWQLIVAVDHEELGRLDDLYKRAQKNGCTVSLVDKDQIREIEPHCQVFNSLFSFFVL